MDRPVESRTRAVLRSPELGFLGRVMPTLRQTPLRCGARISDRAGETAWRARWGLRQPWEERGGLVNGQGAGRKGGWETYAEDLVEGRALDRGGREGALREEGGEGEGLEWLP